MFEMLLKVLLVVIGKVSVSIAKSYVFIAVTVLKRDAYNARTNVMTIQFKTENIVYKLRHLYFNYGMKIDNAIPVSNVVRYIKNASIVVLVSVVESVRYGIVIIPVAHYGTDTVGTAEGFTRGGYCYPTRFSKITYNHVFDCSTVYNYSALDTALHECRHSYQFAYNASILQAYVYPTIDRDAYMVHPAEVDANDYASTYVAVYTSVFKRIKCAK